MSFLRPRFSHATLWDRTPIRMAIEITGIRGPSFIYPDDEFDFQCFLLLFEVEMAPSRLMTVANARVSTPIDPSLPPQGPIRRGGGLKIVRGNESM